MAESTVGIGTVLGGRYRLLALLGKGNMGAVYRAQHIGRDSLTLAAVKVGFQTFESARERAEREARFLRKVHHRNIVPLLGCSEPGEPVAWTAMPLLTGTNVGQLLVQFETLPLVCALAITDAIAEALQCVHEAGGVHRDIKPENIIVTQEGQVKLIDFGCVKLRDDEPEPVSTALTQEKFTIGTPSYMSPEQMRADPRIDGRADIFSLGIVLYELLTSRVPFQGEGTEPRAWSVLALNLALLKYPDPSAFGLSVPICELLRGMLTSVDNRLSLQEVRARIAPLLEGTSPQRELAQLIARYSEKQHQTIEEVSADDVEEDVSPRMLDSAALRPPRVPTIEVTTRATTTPPAPSLAPPSDPVSPSAVVRPGTPGVLPVVAFLLVLVALFAGVTVGLLLRHSPPVPISTVIPVVTVVSPVAPPTATVLSEASAAAVHPTAQATQQPAPVSAPVAKMPVTVRAPTKPAPTSTNGVVDPWNTTKRPTTPKVPATSPTPPASVLPFGVADH